MKKYLGIMMILAVLLAAPAFATPDPEGSGTVNVTVNVSQYAEIIFPNGDTIDMTTDDSDPAWDGLSAQQADNPNDRKWFKLQILANFPYEWELSAPAYIGQNGEVITIEDPAGGPGFPALKANNGGPNGEFTLPYAVRVANDAKQIISANVPWRTLENVGGEMKRAITTDGGPAGETTTFYLFSWFSTKGSFGGNNFDWAGSDTAFMAGDYEGTLTVTVVPAASENG